MFRLAKILIVPFFVLFVIPVSAFAGEPTTLNSLLETTSVASNKTFADLLWIMIAAFLVFFMQAGFALVETGFTRAKNVANIMMKNMMDFGLGTIVFWAVGFGLMYGVCLI